MLYITTRNFGGSGKLGFFVRSIQQRYFYRGMKQLYQDSDIDQLPSLMKSPRLPCEIIFFQKSIVF